MTHTKISADTSLYRLWCSFPECIGYARYEVGIDGAHVCRKHARLIRRGVKYSFLNSLLRGERPGGDAK